MSTDVSIIATRAKNVLPLASAQLGNEYFYQSLPLCAIDAVYSIGVRYEGVRNTINRYCAHFKLQSIRTRKNVLAQKHEQESVSNFCERVEKYGPDAMAIDVFHNKQRTSPINGILKAEGAYRFAVVLRKYGIEHLQDIGSAVHNHDLEKDILAIPGQTSGISLNYFFMLSGSDDLIKPDRMILTFLKSILGRPVTLSEAQELLAGTTNQLSAAYPHLTPRLLDHEIWKYQRDHEKV
ncbi:MAG: hypothetical protein AB9866_11315 [Syntrophobacteraceae bacterium]